MAYRRCTYTQPTRQAQVVAVRPTTCEVVDDLGHQHTVWRKGRELGASVTLVRRFNGEWEEVA